jgi:pantetheine-phosphate adenylyltransferase
LPLAPDADKEAVIAAPTAQHPALALVALFPGSFDPPTNGHRDVLAGALAIADRVVVAIGTHPGKVPLLSLEDRMALIGEMAATLGAGIAARVSTITFAGLTVDAARAAGATLIVRGVRDGADLDYEMQMSGMNGVMAPEIRTVLLPAAPEVRHVTATLVRQIAGMGGDVSPFVPAAVARKLTQRTAS